jgi:serine/threonine protein kinase
MSLLQAGLEILPGLILLRPLGRGGMGEAWLARDEGRGEDVVAKVLPAGAPPERVALLRREARLVRKLSHPRIVPVYGFRGGDLGSVVTQRYMTGGDVAQRRAAPPLDVVRLGRDVAEALEYLHGLGVVHRDVKPSNELLDAEGRAHLADFGIAAVASADEEGIALRGGGSRASMSPQQAAGDPAQPADDLYSLGALLYELLSGLPPLHADASNEDIETFLPPPVTSAFPVPDSLRSLVGSLLSKRPGDRLPSAAAVRAALEATEAEAVLTPLDPRRGTEHTLPRLPSSGLSAGQLTMLSALAVAAVAVAVWLPRWSRAVVAPTPTPSVEALPEAAGTRPAAPSPSLPARANDPPASSEAGRPSGSEERDPTAPATPRPESPPAEQERPATPPPAPTPDPQRDAEALARHRDAGHALEEREEWGAAAAEYEAALGVDAHVTFALEGRARAAARASLSDGLERHARSAHRLSAEAVACEAEALLERARGMESPGPRLQAQMAALEQALAAARTPVAVAIESDGLTEVAVSRVGRLGTLTRRTLTLRPGVYTAVGSRPGYRDVRRQFTLSPGGAAVVVVVVRCEEAI